MLGNFQLVKGEIVGSGSGLIGVLGLIQGDKNVFLLDSGASSNFMSLSLAQQYGLCVQNLGKQFKVRLANGKIVDTVGVVQLSVIFGSFHYIGRFQLLDC